MKQLFLSLALLIVLECQSQTKDEMEAKTIEVVTFELKDGISKEEASSRLKALNELIKDFDGFIKRSISCNEEGKWVDIVYWTSKELAMKAASEVSKNGRASKLFEIIDEKSIQMNHYQIMDSFNQ